MMEFSVMLAVQKGLLRAPGLCLVLSILYLLICETTQAQVALKNGDVQPMGHWAEFKEIRFTGKAIDVHLRTGYEMAVIFPEPVKQSPENKTLYGCEILIDSEVIGFYPTQSFKPSSIVLIGQATGTHYLLNIQSNPLGERQPIKVLP